jgi:hypothetical protein
VAKLSSSGRKKVAPVPGAPNEMLVTSGGVAPARAKRRPTIKDVDISAKERLSLYSLARLLPKSFLEKSHLKLPFTTYFQDPFVAKTEPYRGLDDKVLVDWEPGFADGPTSARFAVVDYNADTGSLEEPAEWSEDGDTFTSGGVVLDKTNVAKFQFHQQSVWALLQRALEYFEEGNGLGRPIPWAFEGNRLIVVPHAGYGENAYYDRRSKSLQFYYFGEGADRVFTCLSSDIVNHEFAHAVLDGVRPLFNESSSVETAAFHEFIGDISAILLTLRNNELRRALAEATGGRIDKAETLSSIAEEFGNAVKDRPYLRTALNKRKMSDTAKEAHDLSEVMTGAMFDVLIQVAEGYQKSPRDQSESGEVVRVSTPKKAFWDASERMQRMTIQPLDLLPPVEVTFRDYALAVCRAQKLSDPIDPRGYYSMLIEVFRKREILSAEDEKQLKEIEYLYDRLRLSVFHSVDDISRSRAAAYRFIDDNREDLLMPANRDFFISDLYDAKKNARQNLPLPRQIILEYVWREEVPLIGPQFGVFNGRITTMLCGGTLVFADNGNVLSWMKKPGSLPWGGKRSRSGATKEQWDASVREGLARRDGLCANIAAQVAAGRVGTIVGMGKGLLGSRMPPMTDESDGEFVRFQLTPHLHLSEDSHKLEAEDLGARRWEISC